MNTTAAAITRTARIRLLSSAAQAARSVSSATTSSDSSSSSDPSSSNTSSSSTSSSSSSSSSSSWTPALPAGSSKAYDAALEYLQSHSSRTLSRLSKLSAQPPTPENHRLIEQLQIQAYSEDPLTRRMFTQTGGKGQMDKPVMRYLAEQKWQKQGGLDLLMQRVHQLQVVPDLIPTIGKTCPLDIGVSPGSIRLPSEWSEPPSMRLQLFHHPDAPSSSSSSTPEGLYTLLVVDPDSPQPETHSYSQRLHYVKTDIPLSVLSGEVNLSDNTLGKEVLSWEPPAPPKGSDKHRYVFLVLRQSTSLSTEINWSRENFDLRTYLSTQNLSAQDITGISLFRSQWSKEEDEYINSTYLKHRGVEAPVYGKFPKEMKYGYPMKAKARMVEQLRQRVWDEAVSELEDVKLQAEEFAQREQEQEQAERPQFA